jgi:hypothetical protein
MRKLAEVKTKPNSASVELFLDSIVDEKKRKESQTILQMMERASKERPALWGSSIIGFGNVRMKSKASGREVEWFKVGFSPRKANFSVQLGDLRPHSDALNNLGKYKAGVGCLYFNKLEDIDINILEKIITDHLQLDTFVAGTTVI